MTPRPRTKVCSTPAGDRRAESRGWCNKHYLRWRTHGDPTIVRTPGRKPTRPRRKKNPNGRRIVRDESPNILTGRWVLDPRTLIYRYQEN